MSQVVSLKPAERAFTRDPEQSFTLPAHYYYTPEIFEREKDAIFYRSWQYVGHISQLPDPGCYLTAKIHQQNVFVIRGEDGELRAFYNVCQHRGHELLEGAGIAKSIVCPYHAWSYRSNGELKRARNTEALPGFNACEFALKQLRVEVLLGLVFVNCDPNAASLASQTAGLREEMRHYVPRIDELVYARRDQYRAAANWKVMVDNFLECYHCAPAHRDFVDLVDMPSYRSKICGIYSSHISTSAGTGQSSAYDFEPGEVDFGYAAWYLWPNTTIWVMPGEANISVLQINPLAPETSGEFLDWYLLSAELSPQMRAASEYLDKTLQPEDIGLCESVQRGLHSFGYNQGRFVVDPERSELSEHAVHHFQSMVFEALGESPDN